MRKKKKKTGIESGDRDATCGGVVRITSVRVLNKKYISLLKRN